MTMLVPRRPQIPDWTAYLAQRAEHAQDARLARFFEAGTPSPDTPVRDVPMVALDMETTGLDARNHAIVSIGIVPFSLGRIQLSERRYWVVRPQRTLHAESVTFHHITHTDIEQAPEFGDVLEDLLEALQGRLVVVHYRHIERLFLDDSVKARLGEGLMFPMIDTMAVEARFQRQTWLARFKRWVGRPPASIRLFDSRARYGLPAYQGHHALTDALATAELLQAQVAHHYEPEMPIGQLWT
ncbi:3'-5' exonuclease [Halomonas sabkhae]|uniref:3'-5' exonuclease n=1 Tax=Halomonas sabkhae TaxID=626223 RepID=UPI0025B4E2C9|nr:3'-5' exonuclease [Halomonas sabkhae]MDN3524199.1 3'-5' exonuclease [Halomonas sabkhae]